MHDDDTKDDSLMKEMKKLHKNKLNESNALRNLLKALQKKQGQEEIGDKGNFESQETNTDK